MVSFTNMKIQVNVYKFAFEGIQLGAHIFEKKFHVYKILFAAADGMAPQVAPCHLLSQKLFAVSVILLFFTVTVGKISSATPKVGHGNICMLIKCSTGVWHTKQPDDESEVVSIPYESSYNS